MSERQPFDEAAYMARVESRPCFICAMLAGDPDFAHHVIYEDEAAIVFLNKYPTLPGYTLVCPKAHREQVTGDFDIASYLQLQALIHAVGEAVRKVFEAERVYVLSLGSQQANRHVHWHVAPLPAGVALEAQQLAALDPTKGVLEIDEAEMAEMACRIAAALDYRVGTGVSPR